MLTTQEAQTTGGTPRAEADAHDALIGTVLLSKLRVLRRIGAGGAGVVYEVEHLITKHRRALKTLKATSRDSPVQISRFLREAGIAGRLKSPRIVETFDAGRLADGTPYVLMELLDGRSLGAVLREDGPIEPTRLVQFALEVCEALEAAHAAGVVHRDIKPENIFLVEPRVAGAEGTGERAPGGTVGAHVKVLDFGVCKALDPSFDEIATLTGEGTSVGTPYFMAPEQIEGSDAVDARTDVYALGVTLYQLASGELPFTAASAAALAVKIDRGTYRSLDVIAKRVSPRFARAIEKAMARQPGDRFESISAMRAELEDIALEPGSDITVSGVIARPVVADELAETSTALVRDARRSRLRTRSLVGLGAALVLGAGVFIVPKLWNPEAPSLSSGAAEAPTSDATAAGQPSSIPGATTAAPLDGAPTAAELEPPRVQATTEAGAAAPKAASVPPAPSPSAVAPSRETRGLKAAPQGSAARTVPSAAPTVAPSTGRGESPFNGSPW